MKPTIWIVAAIVAAALAVAVDHSMWAQRKEKAMAAGDEVFEAARRFRGGDEERIRVLELAVQTSHTADLTLVRVLSRKTLPLTEGERKLLESTQSRISEYERKAVKP